MEAVAARLRRRVPTSVEAVQLLYSLMFTTCNIVRDNLFLEKVCILDMDNTEEECYNLTHEVS